MTPLRISVLILLASALTAPAAVTVITERNENDDATARFMFENIPAPSKNDAASGMEFRLVDGNRDTNGGKLNILNDGTVPSGSDNPRDNFFLAAGTDGGRIMVNLGKVIDIKQINTYSWHNSKRGPQVFTLYASDGQAQGFNAEPKRGTDPVKCGWQHVANVDTRPPEGKPGGQYAACISESGGSIGKYRYLLFDISRTDGKDAFDNTFLSEIDVIDRNGPEPIPIDVASMKLIRDTLEIENGKYKIIIDTSETPELTEWTRTELAPMLKEWYPRLIKLLDSRGYEPPVKFSVFFDSDMEGVAATGGTKITCAAKWVGGNLKGEALGAIFHEMVHVVQQYGVIPEGSQKPPGWLVEGMTDYLRFFIFEPQTNGARITKNNIKNARYDGSYRITAAFLNWVSEKHGKDFVTKLNAGIREGRYGEELWKQLSGHTVHELGEAWKSDLEKSFENK